MGVKQDRTYARTAQDLERKWKFGKSFAELLGLINDNRDKVDSVESSLKDEIRETSTTLKRDTEQIVMEAIEIIDGVESKVSQLKSTADAIEITVKDIERNGAGRVETQTGYTLDSDGLNISKSGSEISNNIDNTGMYVKKSGRDVLTANANGVKATDLHANTYLIIGQGNGRSRFEDYDPDRTACFWIGG